MIRHAKFISLRFDDRAIMSRLAPQSIDMWDGSCPACGSKRYFEIMTIVQSGFIEDDCISVCECRVCHSAFHYHYTVEAAGVAPNDPESSSAEGG